MVCVYVYEIRRDVKVGCWLHPALPWTFDAIRGEQAGAVEAVAAGHPQGEGHCTQFVLSPVTVGHHTPFKMMH